jgi:aminopeptidase-like protein/aminoglycoside N3'-acetyltransferase
MPVKEFVFTKTDLVQGLAAAGVRAGDVLFVQISLPRIGQMEGANSVAESCQETLAALLKVIGPDGTLFVPAFTLSFERREDFDPVNSPALAGDWGESAEFAEVARRHSGAVRSEDPLYSVVGIGPMAEQLLFNLPNTSFGRDSVFERLLKLNARLCQIGVDLRHSVLFDYLEESAEVPWRYKKLFTGKTFRAGVSQRQGWIASVTNKAIAEHSRAIRNRFASEAGNMLSPAPIGAGEIFSAEMTDLSAFLTSKLLNEARNGPLDGREVSATNPQVQLPQAASMRETISALWRLPRDIVSDGYDAALQALATQIPMDVHEYPTGTECLTWLIPEKWTCRDARLETVDGRVLFSYRDNPLHSVSYSLPFDGMVTREELLQHLHTHPRLDDAIPFIFKYYERDWGLCCSKNLKDSLQDEKYRVLIDSEFSFGTLKVGECIVRGESDQTFVLCAHLCHPAMVNDDLSGVVVGIQVMQEMLKRPKPRYTYRFIILPETIGSVAYLSDHLQLVPKMVGGLFLEMLGLDNPHALQLSFNGHTEMDRCMSGVLTSSSPDAWIGAFRTVVGNDERQFNAPGIRVPMLSLSRVLRDRSNGWPYFPEYHSSHDTPELAQESQLAESRDLVLRMIDAIETNEVPVNLFQGEVFCSRYGLHIDAYSNPEGNRALFDILFLVDGTLSVNEIARICGISLKSVRLVLEELRTRGLIAYAPLQRN